MLAVEYASTGPVVPELLSGPAQPNHSEEHSDSIQPDDAADLRAFFGAGGATGAFLGSSFGAQLDRVERYAFRAKPCRRCGGDPTLWTGGSGFVASTRKARIANQQQVEYLALIGIEVAKSGLLPPPGDTECRKCHGRGWVVPTRPSRSANKAALTARPTGSSKHGVGPSSSVSGTDIALIGRIGRFVDELGGLSRRSVEELASWFGTPRDEGGMSIRALWHLTPAGKTMLRRNNLDLPPALFFENERSAQAEKPDANRKQSFQAADAQAQEQWRATCRLWNHVRTGSHYAAPVQIAAE
jgi:ribosomal protein L40E